MKFWQKAFLGILAVFVLSINICLYLTSEYSFSLNMKRDTDRALGEYHFIINGVYDTMNSIFYRDQVAPHPSSIDSIMHSYADYYKTQGVFLEFRQPGKLLFSNIPSGAANGLRAVEFEQNEYNVRIRTSSGVNYMYIAGKLGGQFGDYSLIYVRDLSALYNAHTRLTRYLISVSTLIEIILSLVLICLLRRLTRPIRIMQRAADKIAGGVYDERIKIPGKDEFHDLAENFNQMASNIQEKIGELDKNAQDKQRLIDNLAHELRTPLTAIRGYAEFLQGANSNEQNRIKAAGYIISEADRMKNLAFKLLDLALLRNNKLELQKIAPLELFRQVKAASEAKLQEKYIQLNIHSTIDMLTGDTVLLQSLLLNLIDNAVKASANGAAIEMSAYFDSVPVLEVTDSGCGMEEEQTTLVCEPFYRADKARSRSSGGVGLGLSLCSEIAHLHGAELRISSRPDIGTSVKIVFTTPLQLPENSVT